MKFLSIKGRLSREKFKKFESRYLVLKSVTHNRNLPINFRWEAVLLLTKLAKNSSRSLIKNRCFFTGRSRGFFRFFSLSRIQLRTLARNNELFTVRKASW